MSRHCETCGSFLYDAIGEQKPERGRIGSPADAYLLLRRKLARARQEKLIAIYLDAQNRMIGSPVVISVGALNTTRTQPRELLAPAIKRAAASIIIAHNHPSGSLEPSNDDIAFTRTMIAAAELMGFTLYDHLIISRKGYISLRDKGHLT